MEIIHGDCINIMDRMNPSSVDLIVTSPPYNNWRNRRTQKRKKAYWDRTNITYGNHCDKMTDIDYHNWQVDFLNSCVRVLKDTGTLVYNHKDRIFNFEVTSPLSWIFDSDCKYRQRITWDRCGMQAFNPVRFYRTEEDIYILGKLAKGFKWNKECAKFKSIWKIPPSSKKYHPAAFPMEIPSRCIKAFTDKKDIVLDPFCGSGTTGLACLELDRDFIGIDNDKNCIQITQERCGINPLIK